PSPKHDALATAGQRHGTTHPAAAPNQSGRFGVVMGPTPRAKAIPVPLRVAFPRPHRLLLLLALLPLAAAAPVGAQRDAGASSAAPSDGSNPDAAAVATTDLIVL